MKHSYDVKKNINFVHIMSQKKRNSIFFFTRMYYDNNCQITNKKTRDTNGKKRYHTEHEEVKET